LATKKAPSTKKAPEAKTRVTRIRATDTKTEKTKTEKTAPSKSQTAVKVPRQKPSFGKAARPFVLMGGYFKGAWQELREVRWPDRRATWSMTGALLGFTAFVVTLVLLLDALFKYLFELILQ
jgi:preprotein translocase subunit SecE